MIFLPIIHRYLFSKELYRLEQLPQSTENHLKQTQSLHHQTLTQYEGSNLRILVNTLKLDHLLCKPFSYELIPAKAQLLQGDDDTVYMENDCFIAYSNWRSLTTFREFKSSKVIRGDQTNLLFFLKEFLPKHSCRSIGFFTCQNGIQNDPDDFKLMCESIISKFAPENPLFIGLYNRTNGKGLKFVKDLNRLRDEWRFNLNSILFTRQMFKTFSTLLPAINPSLLWTHIAHSEAGLIAKNCLTDPIYGVSPREKNALKENLVTLLYGAVAPIPKGYCKISINNYSTEDITLRFVRKHLNKKLPQRDRVTEERLRQVSQFVFENMKKKEFSNISTAEDIYRKMKQARDEFMGNAVYPYESDNNNFKITLLESITEKLHFIAGDHTFTDDTYQAGLKNDIDNLREDIGIHHAQYSN